MKQKQLTIHKIHFITGLVTVILLVVLAIVTVNIATAKKVEAADPKNPCAGGKSNTKECVKRCEDNKGGIGCEESEVCDPDTSSCIFDRINAVIRFLAAGVGIVVTIMIIVGGIQYSSAGGDPQKVAVAKQRITNAIIALVTFFLLFAVLQWLLPGGLL